MIEKAIGVVVVGIGGLVLTALGVDIYQNRKVAEKVDMSVKGLKNATAQDIHEGMLRKAVEEAANATVGSYVREIKSEVVSSARQTLNDEARKAVRNAQDIIQREVSERISTEASMIDMSELKRSARNKAEEKILDKFDGNLEDLLTKFNDNLSNVQKIYGGIADAISKTNNKDKEIKFSLS
jgi:hypothetical protein